MVARSTSCPAPREFRFARAVSCVSFPSVMELMAFPPSATSPRQFMKLMPTVLELGLEGSSLCFSTASQLPPYATSLFADTAPALTTSFAPGVTFHRFSSLVPSASAPPTKLADAPAATLFVAQNFHRVSARAV